MNNFHTGIYIVSGLPRSGTSLMMQMLEAGGVPVVSDNIRRPDRDNPRGYYEMEPVKHMERSTDWLENCRGRAVKIVTPHLFRLPDRFRYRLILMVRDLQETVRSQAKMLKRRKTTGSRLTPAELVVTFQQHLDDVRHWLSAKDNLDFIEVAFSDLFTQPEKAAHRVAAFLECSADKRAMASAVDPALYRQKGGV